MYAAIIAVNTDQAYAQWECEQAVRYLIGETKGKALYALYGPEKVLRTRTITVTYSRFRRI